MYFDASRDLSKCFVSMKELAHNPLTLYVINVFKLNNKHFYRYLHEISHTCRRYSCVWSLSGSPKWKHKVT